jgi:putative ABC transport system substrate-binding protein
MRRRDLLAGLMALPGGAHAQARPARVGLLGSSEPSAAMIEALRDSLRQRGHVEGRTLTLDVRALGRSPGQDAEVAAEMAGSGVDVIVAWATAAALAARRATSTIPIVMVSIGDPIGSGLVRNLARPDGNVTGVVNLGRDLSAKQVELFVETVPGRKEFGMVQNRLNPSSLGQSREAQAAMRELGLAAQVVEASSAAQYVDALLRLSQGGVGGVFFVPDPSTLEHRAVIAEQAIARRLPTMFQRRENVAAGGLMSYGASLIDQFRQAAGYVDRILKGARPADLPVEQPTTFELVVNLKTARALGIALPRPVLARAQEVIE